VGKPLEGFVRLPPGEIKRGILGADDEVEVVRVDEGVPERVGERVAHFSDDEFGVVHGCWPRPPRARAAVPAAVRGSDPDEGGVEPHHPERKKPGSGRNR
jgi:hypothetical protein